MKFNKGKVLPQEWNNLTEQYKAGDQLVNS